MKLSNNITFFILAEIIVISSCRGPQGSTGSQGPAGPSGTNILPTLTASLASGCYSNPTYDVTLNQNYGQCPSSLSCTFNCYLSNSDCTSSPNECNINGGTQTWGFPVTNCNLSLLTSYIALFSADCAGQGQPCGSVNISCT